MAAKSYFDRKLELTGFQYQECESGQEAAKRGESASVIFQANLSVHERREEPEFSWQRWVDSARSFLALISRAIYHTEPGVREVLLQPVEEGWLDKLANLRPIFSKLQTPRRPGVHILQYQLSWRTFDVTLIFTIWKILHIWRISNGFIQKSSWNFALKSSNLSCLVTNFVACLSLALIQNTYLLKKGFSFYDSGTNRLNVTLSWSRPL